MKLGMFTPLPPSESGIADYSAALLEHLRPLTPVECFSRPEEKLNPVLFDGLVYQIGNNPDHIHAYETALAHPGVVVLHEANLHHLIAALTIKRQDWEGYFREVEHDGGPEALRHAQRVRALEVGPDYEGVPMLRRLLGRTRGLIAHSDFVIAACRRAGYDGPAARIPHGAWIPEMDRMAYRQRLGIAPEAPLFGIFGHLKPYKRIAESLRAFKRVLRHHPNARMILVGEPHPDFPVQSLLKSLRVEPSVRVLGRAGIQDFVGYLSACDTILNLRHPTVGETSGTLLRAFGLGRAVLISENGAFAEFPDEICIKIPVTSREEDLLAESMMVLAERPDLAADMGRRAQEWVRRECSWDRVATMYLGFIESVYGGKPWTAPPRDVTPASEATSKPGPIAEPEYLRSWAADPEEAGYIETHITRLSKTLDMTPLGDAGQRILEMGAYLQITPALKSKLGYGAVRGCYYGEAGHVDHKLKVSRDGERFETDIDLFDAEKDPFPYPSDWFDTVLCCELLEHLPNDPMHMMSEIHRILKPGGHLVLTTPNIASLRALNATLQGFHPGFFPAYIRPAKEGEPRDARHNREYTAKEVYRLLHDSGFTVMRLETGPFRDEPHPDLLWVEDMLRRYRLPDDLRGDGIYAVGQKTGRVRERYPDWLYS